jgi:hypothetical protein
VDLVVVLNIMDQQVVLLQDATIVVLVLMVIQEEKDKTQTIVLLVVAVVVLVVVVLVLLQQMLKVDKEKLFLGFLLHMVLGVMEIQKELWDILLEVVEQVEMKEHLILQIPFMLMQEQD